MITACGGGIVNAQTLTIGVQLETASIDPHFSIVNPSVSAARHLFDTLAHPDEQQHLHPGLALSWPAASGTEWEFRLRPGVRFHDGSPFTAEDVAFSLARAPPPRGIISKGSYQSENETVMLSGAEIVLPLLAPLASWAAAAILRHSCRRDGRVV